MAEAGSAQVVVTLCASKGCMWESQSGGAGGHLTLPWGADVFRVLSAREEASVARPKHQERFSIREVARCQVPGARSCGASAP